MLPLKAKNVSLKNRYVLAPMAGYTDFSYRKMCGEYGAGLVYTEMISANALCYNSKETFKMINETYKDTDKLCLQLFGGDVEIMVKAIKILEQNSKYDFLDINLGCSVNKVLKQHAGAYFVDKKDELENYITSIVKASSKPVFVKTRIGPNDDHITIYENLKIFEKANVSLVAIHARSRIALYSGEPHYDIIKRAKDSTYLPILANGNIGVNNFEDVLNYTNADGVMIGRETLGYPKIFKDLIDLEEKKELTPTTLKNQIQDLIRHINYMSQTKTDYELSNIMRSIACCYFKGFSDAKKIRMKLISLTSKEQYLSVLNELLSKAYDEQRRNNI